MQPIKDIVNSRLKDLQQILSHNSPINLSLTKTFDDYLAFEAQNTQKSKTAQNEYAATIAPAAPVAAAVPAPAPVAAVVPAPVAPVPMAVAPAPVAAAPAVSAVDQAKRDLEAITDKAEQQAYFGKLTPEVREALKPWLKERKEKAAAAVSQAELDDLF
jgi:hypothetical protein